MSVGFKMIKMLIIPKFYQIYTLSTNLPPHIKLPPLHLHFEVWQAS